MRKVSRRSALAGLSALMPTIASAQSIYTEDPETPYGRYFPTLLRLRHEYVLNSEKTPWATDFYRQYWAILGNESAAIEGWWYKEYRQKQRVDFSDYVKSSSAISHIANVAGKYDIVIINENHRISRCRLFCNELLLALKDVGFKHFAAEDFHPCGADGCVESYSKRENNIIHHKYGVYITDPVYAETVRSARSAGYQIWQYQGSSFRDRSAKSANIELEHAQNILEILDHTGSEKLVIYCGHEHLRRKNDEPGNFKWLAQLMLERTDRSMLAIDQSQGGSQWLFEPDVSQGDFGLDFSEPSILLDSKGGVIGNEIFETDLAVFFPKKKDVDGRPGWLAESRLRSRLAVDVGNARLSYPLIAKAVHAGTPDNIIPADQYYVENGVGRFVFYVPSGLYDIVVETADGNTVIARERAV